MDQKQKWCEHTNITKTKMSPLFVRTLSGYSEFDPDCLGLVSHLNLFIKKQLQGFSKRYAIIYWNKMQKNYI